MLKFAVERGIIKYNKILFIFTHTRGIYIYIYIFFIILYLLRPTILSGTLISSLHIPPTLEEDVWGLDDWLPESPIELLPPGPPRIPIKGSATNAAIFFASGSKYTKNIMLITIRQINYKSITL